MNAKILSAVLISGCAAIYLSYAGAQYFLTGALEREARLTGMDWAHHVEHRLTSMVTERQLDVLEARSFLPKSEELNEIVAHVFAIGHMYQFDYINVICHCHVSLNADDVASDFGQGSHVGHNHSNASSRASRGANNHAQGSHKSSHGSVPTNLWNHVLKNKSLHLNPTTNTKNPHNVPIDRDVIRRIVKHRTHDIIVRKNSDPNFPATLAEVYHPVESEEEVLYLVRIIIDLEEQAKFYNQFMLTAVAITLFFLAVAVGYPILLYRQAAQQRKRADKRVQFLANHDVLTNLHNRNNFHEAVSDILWSCHENHQSAYLFVFDLNGFKEVNDYHGHPVGDRMLCEFATKLKESVPKDSYIARLGGDEFVVVIGGINDSSMSYRDMFDIPKVVSVSVHGSHQTATASVAGGVVKYPRDAETTEQLIQLADLALYAAKPNRSGEICEYTPQMKDAFFDRLKIRDEFREALNASQIEPFYQPIVNMKTGKVEGFEALARWIHPEKGTLTPFVFADVFDDPELCALLGQQIFAKITNDMAFWNNMSVPFKKVAFNVTDGDLKADSFAKDILTGLANHGLKPANLTIEVTENCLFGSDKQRSVTHLESLRAAGCGIALDDFGTGYSSITQLKQLPITAIKIDKSFIDDVLDNEDDRSIVNAMLELGQSMGFDLVMEGIETSKQLNLLARMGSELAQGYYFSRPVPAAEVPALIDRQNSSYAERYEKLYAG